jgi:hypothetical protein
MGLDIESILNPGYAQDYGFWWQKNRGASNLMTFNAIIASQFGRNGEELYTLTTYIFEDGKRFCLTLDFGKMRQEVPGI